MKTCRSHLACLFVGVALAAGAPARAQQGDAKSELVVIQKKEPAPGAPVQLSRFQMALGAALAERMGRPVRFIDLPRNRMVAALETGEGDLLCGYLPVWLPGAFDWSRGFIPVAEVVVYLSHAPALESLAELKDKRVGTVLGFRYPELEAALGAHFVRDDAMSEDLSILKLIAGRFNYAVTTRATIESHQRRGDLPEPARQFVINEFSTMCAVSRLGRVKAEEVNRAIDAIVKSGELARLLRER